MLINNENFARVSPIFQDGDIIEDSNLSQQNPHTPICVGVRGLVFRRCNLVNCDLPIDATLDDCNTMQLNFVVDDDGNILGIPA